MAGYANAAAWTAAAVGAAISEGEVGDPTQPVTTAKAAAGAIGIAAAANIDTIQKQALAFLDIGLAMAQNK